MPKATLTLVHAAGLWGPHRHLMDLLSCLWRWGQLREAARLTAGGHLCRCWERVGGTAGGAACPPAL